MDKAEAFEAVVKILTPHVKNQEALASVSDETHILDDLKVNSARLVDVVRAAANDDRNAGFSSANRQQLYLPIVTDPEYHFEAVNVDLTTADPSNYTQGPTSQDQVMCLTCHRAHATSAPGAVAVAGAELNLARGEAERRRLGEI